MHPLERRPHGGIAGQVALFPGIIAQVEQLLADVPFAANVRPLTVVDGPQWPGLAGQAPGVAIERVTGNDLGQRGILGSGLRRRRRPIFAPESRAANPRETESPPAGQASRQSSPQGRAGSPSRRRPAWSHGRPGERSSRGTCSSVWYRLVPWQNTPACSPKLSPWSEVTISHVSSSTRRRSSSSINMPSCSSRSATQSS